MKGLVAFGIVIVGLCILLCPAAGRAGQASTEQWKYFGANEKGERFFYDAASVIYVSNVFVKVWTRELTSGPPTKRLKEINCPSKAIRDLQVIVETTGKAPRTGSLAPSEWRAIENVPPMKELHKAVCR